MKTLLVMRHAKSSWKQKELDDHDRLLNSRGRAAAPRMGKLLADQHLIPDLIVSSTALRARHTAELVAEHCGCPNPVETTPDLYMADPQSCLSVVRQYGDDYQQVLIVGHNPGLERLVELFTGRAHHFPTAAVAQFSLTIDSWKDLGRRTPANLVHLWRPREVEDGSEG